MDNLSSQKGTSVYYLIQARSVTLHFLPFYSLDLNLIEKNYL